METDDVFAELEKLETTEVEMRELLEELIGENGGEFEIASTRSFADAGVMTMNEGLVVRMENGSEMQLTIVRSR